MKRNGLDVPYAESGLLPCDEIRLLDAAARVRVTLVNGDRVVLDVDRRSLKLPCDTVGAGEAFVKVLRSFSGQSTGPSKTPVLAATKGAPLNVAGLGPYSPRLTSGTRSLFVGWNGGIGPYSVRLMRYGDATPLAEVAAIPATSVTLPSVQLRPGRHVLEVRQADGSGVREDDLLVVTPEELPSLPRQLQDASNLSLAERKLLTAFFLEGQADGRWSLEALQLAASVKDSYALADDWLRRRGTAP